MSILPYRTGNHCPECQGYMISDERQHSEVCEVCGKQQQVIVQGEDSVDPMTYPLAERIQNNDLR